MKDKRIEKIARRLDRYTGRKRSGNMKRDFRKESVSEEDVVKHLVEDFGEEYKEEIEETFTMSGGHFEFNIDGDGYEGYETEDQAVAAAENQARENMEYDPGVFDKDWISQWIRISDADRIPVIFDLVDSKLADLSIKEIMEYGDLEKYDQDIMTKSIDDFRADLYKLDEEGYPEGTLDDWTEEEIIDEAIDTLGDDEVYEYDRVFEATSEKISYEIDGQLEDPIKYFVEEQGLYSLDELLDQEFIEIDYSPAASDVVGVEGWAHFISHYDGNYDELSGGEVIFRAG